MSDYKRFISYVYEYYNGRKRDNRGYIKVEAKGNHCHLEFHLKGIMKNGDGLCQIYGFRRNSGSLLGSYIIEVPVAGGILETHLDTSREQIGDALYSLDELKGILIQGPSEDVYATGWDDEPLLIDTFFPDTRKDISDVEKPTNTSPEGISSEPPSQHSPESNTEKVEVSPQDNPPDSQPDVQATSTDPDCSPFKDGQIIDCRKISPKDICHLNPQDQHLKNNRFLHYGYQMFNHLLIGRLADTDQHILCVPGTYNQQECFMANMFGFNNFKRCPPKGNYPRCFGYWYRLIQSTDGHL